MHMQEDKLSKTWLNFIVGICCSLRDPNETVIRQWILPDDKAMGLPLVGVWESQPVEEKNHHK